MHTGGGGGERGGEGVRGPRYRPFLGVGEREGLSETFRESLEGGVGDREEAGEWWRCVRRLEVGACGEGWRW